ncbi:MAG: HEAT repeat domain-containing protein [Candidatus Muirbacterium halophilum]|nr:HEAT repeat domain-containing protein [Candidatus Muirbacterium halophilum]
MSDYINQFFIDIESDDPKVRKDALIKYSKDILYSVQAIGDIILVEEDDKVKYYATRTLEMLYSKVIEIKESLRMEGNIISDENPEEKYTFENFLDLIKSDNAKIKIENIKKGVSKFNPKLILPYLKETLFSENDTYVIATLVKAIGYIGSLNEINVLLKYLKDNDPRIRANTIEGLEFIKEPEVFKHLVPMLKDKNPRVIANAAKALQKFGKENVLTLLEKMLTLPKKEMRDSAVFALSKIISEPSAYILLKHYEFESDSELIQKIEKAIENMIQKGITTVKADYEEKSKVKKLDKIHKLKNEDIHKKSIDEINAVFNSTDENSNIDNEDDKDEIIPEIPIDSNIEIIAVEPEFEIIHEPEPEPENEFEIKPELSDSELSDMDDLIEDDVEVEDLLEQEDVAVKVDETDSDNSFSMADDAGFDEILNSIKEDRDVITENIDIKDDKPIKKQSDFSDFDSDEILSLLEKKDFGSDATVIDEIPEIASTSDDSSDDIIEIDNDNSSLESFDDILELVDEVPSAEIEQFNVDLSEDNPPVDEVPEDNTPMTDNSEVDLSDIEISSPPDNSVDEVIEISSPPDDSVDEVIEIDNIDSSLESFDDILELVDEVPEDNTPMTDNSEIDLSDIEISSPPDDSVDEVIEISSDNIENIIEIDETELESIDDFKDLIIDDDSNNDIIEQAIEIQPLKKENDNNVIEINDIEIDEDISSLIVEDIPTFDNNVNPPLNVNDVEIEIITDQHDEIISEEIKSKNIDIDIEKNDDTVNNPENTSDKKDPFGDFDL